MVALPKKSIGWGGGYDCPVSQRRAALSDVIQRAESQLSRRQTQASERSATPVERLLCPRETPSSEHTHTSRKEK